MSAAASTPSRAGSVPVRLLEPVRPVVSDAPHDGRKAVRDLEPDRRQQRARAPLEQVAREDLVAHHRDAIDHLLGANPGQLRRPDRAIERAGKSIEACALRRDGGRFRLVLRRGPETFDLASHLGELRPQRFCRGRELVDDAFDVGAQALQLTLQLLELLDRFLGRLDALGQPFDGTCHLGRQHGCGGRGGDAAGADAGAGQAVAQVATAAPIPPTATRQRKRRRAR